MHSNVTCLKQLPAHGIMLRAAATFQLGAAFAQGSLTNPANFAMVVHCYTCLSSQNPPTLPQNSHDQDAHASAVSAKLRWSSVQRSKAHLDHIRAVALLRYLQVPCCSPSNVLDAGVIWPVAPSQDHVGKAFVLVVTSCMAVCKDLRSSSSSCSSTVWTI